MNSNKKNKWQGLRAIVVARQSSDKDGDASTAAQDSYMAVTLAKVGMHHVETIPLEGLSGSWPARIDTILQTLFRRKAEKNDFDVIAWQVEDRASRSGGEHGLWLQHEAKRHGLLVFFPDDADRETPAAFRAFKYDAAMDAAMSTGRRTAQGQNHAQKTGFFRTAGQTPFGCDRIYHGEDHQPKFILHNLPNGTQEQRAMDTGKVIGRYGTPYTEDMTKSRNRYKKQKNEYALLYPGDWVDRRIVRIIFYLRYKRGWRGFRVADFLNRNRVRSPRGKEWSPRQVESLYENEAYTGVTYNNQTFSGRYYRRDRVLGFVPLDRDECELVMKKSFTPKLRPMDDWERIDQPHMYDFLPADVRDLAIAAQAQRSENLNDPNRKRKTPSAHPASLFFLSGRLRALQEGTLVGTMSGPKGHTVPYYRHRRGKRGVRKGSIFNNLIPAKPLHDAILGLLAEVMLDNPDLRDRLRQQVLGSRAAAASTEPRITTDLQAERDDLQLKIVTLTATLSGAALKAAMPELQRLNERVNTLSAQIDAGTPEQVVDHRPVETVVEEVVLALQHDRARLHTLAPQALRQLTDRLITDAVVDMQTKEVHLTVALPTRAPKASAKKNSKSTSPAPENAGEPLCPATSSRSPAYDWTQTITLTANCHYAWTRGSHTVPPCYQCRRSAA